MDIYDRLILPGCRVVTIMIDLYRLKELLLFGKFTLSPKRLENVLTDGSGKLTVLMIINR